MLVTLRDWIDGRLHARRRRRAIRRMLSVAPSSVLFVCLGNVCRSPYAASVWRRDSRIPAQSGGYLGPGRSPPDEAIRVARARGIEHASHVSKLVTAEMLRTADLVFVFDRFNVAQLARAGARLDRVVWLGDFDPVWTGKRAIIDPWGKSIDEFASTFERIDRCVGEAARLLARG